MGQIIWTDPAIDDLTAIMDYIARDSPQYALRVGERNLRSSRQGFPRPTRRLDGARIQRGLLREVLMRPYRIIYEIRGEACYIVAIIHGSRDLPRHIQPSTGIE
jgi:toxin ParE1/3/4